MTSDSPLVIVGASYAGLQLAASAREFGYRGRIIMVGEEERLPYQRPPLSKGLLTGKSTIDMLPLRSDAFYRDGEIETVLGRRAVHIDTSGRQVLLDDGQALPYAWLALTTGARCRPLTVPGVELAGVHLLRTLDESLAVVKSAEQAKTACVIGGGFIGLEVAAALQARGLHVTVVEAQSRLLTRSVPPIMSDYIRNAHESRGVRIELGRGLRRLCGKDGRVMAAELADGTEIPCELVVVGIGVIPNDELAREAGIAVDNGILVDAMGRTSIDRVLAAGDVANMHLAGWGPDGAHGRYRFESIQAANDSAKACASVIAGHPKSCDAVPWFWSDQFNLKFQMAGVPQPMDQVVLRGRMDNDKFCLIYLRAGHVAAVHTVNRPADHMLARRLIAARAELSEQQAGDEQFELKQILALRPPSSPAGP
jgi:3-phenylpropionate/trans-cinnamate dioxygenase ferredoxin reductase component